MRVLCRRTNKEYTKYCLAYSLFQSPSSVWRTTVAGEVHQNFAVISIRVLRVEDDQFRMYQPQNVPISIPVLRVEDDKVALKIWRCRLHFNPRPPCGGRPPPQVPVTVSLLFQSTSSVRRTTQPGGGPLRCCAISIHVLRVEDDDDQPVTRLHVNNFNPRPPCGGRLEPSAQACPVCPFQSTSSVWRTTPVFSGNAIRIDISIHVLRVEDDWEPQTFDFSFVISIHVLRVEDDSKNREKSLFAFI